MTIDDDSIYNFMASGPLEGYPKIARACGEVYRAFIGEGFNEDQAFDLTRDYFDVMLDVVPLGQVEDDGDDG